MRSPSCVSDFMWALPVFDGLPTREHFPVIDLSQAILGAAPPAGMFDAAKSEWITVGTWFNAVLVDLG
jgi:hypothetical protein